MTKIGSDAAGREDVKLPGGREISAASTSTATDVDDAPGRAAHASATRPRDLEEPPPPRRGDRHDDAYNADRRSRTVTGPGGTGYGVDARRRRSHRGVTSGDGKSVRLRRRHRPGQGPHVPGRREARVRLRRLAAHRPRGRPGERQAHAHLRRRLHAGARSRSATGRRSRSPTTTTACSTKAGDLALTREYNDGFMTNAKIGELTSTWKYDDARESGRWRRPTRGAARYKVVLTRDTLGRIERRDETVDGDDHAHGLHVRRRRPAADGRARTGKAPRVTYKYDANGNRERRRERAVRRPGPPDRRPTARRTSTAPPASARRRRRTASRWPTATTTGPAAQVDLADGKKIDYVFDGEGRRVARKVDGQLVQGFLYRDALHPIGRARRQRRRGLGVRLRHVAAAAGVHEEGRQDVPDRGRPPRQPAARRRHRDRRGRAADGLRRVRQRHKDTNPGFQPFGFAGGLYDRGTELTHFGARDYDPRDRPLDGEGPARLRAAATRTSTATSTTTRSTTPTRRACGR